MSEITARLIAHVYLSSPPTMPTIPPLKRATENPLDLAIGVPNEFDNADAFLQAIGEGVEESVGDQQTWSKVEEIRRKERIEGFDLRKALLGY